MNFALQRFGQYIESERASSLKRRDYKDATDLVVKGIVGGVEKKIWIQYTLVRRWWSGD